MRIITLNTNGIRAAARKGLFDWFRKQQADVVCIQETKAQIRNLTGPEFFPDGYHCYYHDALKPGYSGTAIYSKVEPRVVRYGLDWDTTDSEGRWLQVDFANLSVVSLYMPSGSSKEERQQIKFEVMDHLKPRLQELTNAGREFVICGDWNIAHRKIDIKNWRGNLKNSGFLPEERDWMTQLFEEWGWVDGFRVAEPGEHQYTWWSNRGKAWENNTGWRIDYQVITRGLEDKVTDVSIYKDERFSDHAPLIMDYDFEIQR